MSKNNKKELTFTFIIKANAKKYFFPKQAVHSISHSPVTRYIRENFLPPKNSCISRGRQAILNSCNMDLPSPHTEN